MLVTCDPAFRYAAVVMCELAPFFAHPWRLEAMPHGTTGNISRIVIQYQKHGDRFATDALDLHLFEGLIEVPYVFLPQHLHQKGLMIRALGRLTEACDADGRHLVISKLVDRYRRSLIARGAIAAPKQIDAVFLHVSMNFAPFADA